MPTPQGRFLLVWAVLSLAACAPSGFGGKVPSASGDAKKAENGGKPSPGPRNGGALGTERDNGDEEDNPTDRPEPVSGAFLTCEREVATDDVAAFGCRVEKDQQKVDLHRVRVDWDIAEGENQRSVRELAHVNNEPENSPWHIRIQMPLDAAEGKVLKATVNWSTPQTYITDLSPLKFYPLGTVHVGDGEYRQSRCPRIVEMVPATTGRYRDIEFEVLSESTIVKVSAWGICGADSAEAGRISIIDADDRERTGQTVSGSQILWELRPVSLQRGMHTLRIMSDKLGSGGFDDFWVGGLSLSSSAPLDLDYP